MRVLFICKYNRFRSKVAEALFNFYCKNKKFKARSRGIIKDVPSAQSVVKIMKERGMALKNKTSRKIKKEDVKWADLIIVVADDIPNNVLLSLFKGKEIKIWRISDVNQQDIKGIQKRVYIIEKKVLNLLERLNKKL